MEEIRSSSILFMGSQAAACAADYDMIHPILVPATPNLHLHGAWFESLARLSFKVEMMHSFIEFRQNIAQFTEYG